MHQKQVGDPGKQLSKYHSPEQISQESLTVTNSKSKGNQRARETAYIHTKFVYTHKIGFGNKEHYSTLNFKVMQVEQLLS